MSKNLEKLFSNGNIYLDKYSGWYAVRDEAFFSESEIVNGSTVWCLLNGLKNHLIFLIFQNGKKTSWFYESNEDFISPKSRRNEVISFVKSGLKDLSISRTSFSWGVKVPNDKSHIMYVWLDALTNYLSACEYSNEEDDEVFKKFWPADIHMVGKILLDFMQFTGLHF